MGQTADVWNLVPVGPFDALAETQLGGVTQPTSLDRIYQGVLDFVRVVFERFDSLVPVEVDLVARQQFGHHHSFVQLAYLFVVDFFHQIRNGHRLEFAQVLLVVGVVGDAQFLHPAAVFHRLPDRDEITDDRKRFSMRDRSFHDFLDETQLVHRYQKRRVDVEILWDRKLLRRRFARHPLTVNRRNRFHRLILETVHCERR